jgi:Mor family transcriptional regulator
MNRLVDHYPETLRDIYDKIEDLIISTHGNFLSVDIPLYITEWIRKNWSGRTLIPGWWGRILAEDHIDQGTLIDVAADSLRTMRGRELRAVVWSILALQVAGQVTGICRLATAIAQLVETEWSRQPVYIPKAPEVDRAFRDALVWQQFSGFANIDRVVIGHGLSQSSIYTIYRRLQKDREAREQPSLFYENP